MPAKEDFLNRKLQERTASHALRSLRLPEGKVDFCSNDYLGIVRNGLIEQASVNGSSPVTGPDPATGFVFIDGASSEAPLRHGSAGSRLLAGNYPLIEMAERELARFHAAPACLIFNSGYDANLGLLSCIPQRGDTILYDQLSHASIRDGIRLSFAKSFSFGHNDLHDLEARLRADLETRSRDAAGNVFIVTESVFSMDGDQAPLIEIARLCDRYGAHLIVDEAHATGVIGAKGEGLVQHLGLQEKCFARVHTFGKAVGCHGALVAGSLRLREYLINFCRAFIYTTALPGSSVQAIRTAYSLIPGMETERGRLRQLIARFRAAPIQYERLNSLTPIQVVIVPGNEAARQLAGRLQTGGLDIRPILYPTVPKGSERLRIVLHAFNTEEEIDRLILLLQ